MNLETLVAQFTKSFDQLNIGLIVDPDGEFTHTVDPDQWGWIVPRHFNGPMGLIYASLALFILGAIIGFALYARQ